MSVRSGGLLVETKSRVVIQRRRFTAEEYHKMAEAGILHEDDRVELIEGEIVDMAPIGSRHATCVRELVWLLSKQLGDELRLDVQNPLWLSKYGEPQPDLAVIQARDYAGALPTPTDVLLLIEVSDTTLRYDREIKLPLYARSGIPEVWIMDLAGEAMERHTSPSGSSYRRMERAQRGETLASEALPTLLLRTDAVLGRSS
jgi:Uma2 family endonuclease